MLAVALALGAALSWGVGDFLGGLKSRSVHVLTVLALSQLAGLAGITIWLLLSRGDLPDGGNAAQAAGAGLAGVIGLGAMYRGMAIGAMGVVAPISAGAAAVPFVAGLVQGERPTLLQIGGALLALLGVVLVSREPAPVGARVARGVGLAFVAAAGFGLFFVLLDAASSANTSAAGTVFVLRATAVTFALAVALAAGINLRPGRQHLPAVIAVGLFDVGANVLFALATTRGLLSVVSVLASLYPVITVALAAVLLRERLAAVQRVGAGTALAGAALLSAG